MRKNYGTQFKLQRPCKAISQITDETIEMPSQDAMAKYLKTSPSAVSQSIKFGRWIGQWVIVREG